MRIEHEGFEVPPDLDPRVTWAVHYMQRHLDEPIRVAALATSVNLSPSRFRHLFRTQAGVGPLQYLQRLRLRRARLLIERTFLSVKEVMALVGYNDPSYFSKDFRRLHQMSPAKLRARGTTAVEIDGPAPSVISLKDSRIGHRRARSPAA